MLYLEYIYIISRSSSSFNVLTRFFIVIDIIFLPSSLVAFLGSPKTPFLVILNDEVLLRKVVYVEFNLFLFKYPRLAICIWTSFGSMASFYKTTMIKFPFNQMPIVDSKHINFWIIPFYYLRNVLQNSHITTVAI